MLLNNINNDVLRQFSEKFDTDNLNSKKVGFQRKSVNHLFCNSKSSPDSKNSKDMKKK